MRHCFIVNPAAGRPGQKKGQARLIVSEIRRLALEGDIYVTRSAGDGIEYARQYCRRHPGRLRFYACGGDGTLNEVVNGVMGGIAEAEAVSEAAGADAGGRISVAAVPWGSGNDFIKNFPAPAAFGNLERQILGRTVKTDLLKVNNRFCVNICNFGFDAQVGHNMRKFKALPLIRGDMAYGLSLLYCFLRKTDCHFSLALDGGETMAGAYLLLVLGNGCFYGGAYKGAPAAKTDDGLMDLVVIKKMSRWQMARLIKIYKAGLHLEHPALAPFVAHRKIAALRVRTDSPAPICIDGEFFQEMETRVELLPQALNFVNPAW
ncbi:MAG: hypothetical protein LBK98_02180 [Peptococcaceae bacterium]|jgi:diacylglycerol kinase family enzyme|nr:hypothetical protein [Peptococcaceae bacterium]